MGQPLPDNIESSAIARITWRLVPFLFLLYIVAYLDRINVGFAALQMQAQLGFSDAVYGLGAGMFFAGYFVFQLPSNLILQRVGARRWISVLMIAWGVTSSCMVFVTTQRSFYWLRFLLGIAEAGFFPGVILYLKHWFPPNARARTVARFMTAAPLSGVIGGPISGALLSLHQRAGLAGWQWLFLMEGVPAIVLGTVVLACLDNRPEEARWLPSAEKDWLLATLHREREAAIPSETRAVSGLANPRVWLLAFVYFGLNTCSYGVSMWLPNVIHSVSGVKPLVLGILSAIPYVAAAVAMVIVGLHSDRSGERRWHTALPALAGAIALVFAAYSASTTPVIAGLSVALLGVFAMMGPFWSMPTTFLSGAAAATGIALINSIGNLGGFFGPYIIGLLRTSTGEFRGGLIAVGVTLALSGFLAASVRAVPTRVVPRMETSVDSGRGTGTVQS
jgi:MFS transporter, ACS family, tartrate transporter